MQVRRPRRKRTLQRTVLSLFYEVAHWQHERGLHGDRTAGMLENPLRSLAWRQEPLQATLGMPGLGTAVMDACVWGKRRPDTGELVRMPSMAVGTPAVVAAVDVRCTGDHDYCVIEGAMHCPSGSNQWRRMAIAGWVGGYTAEFCKAFLHGVRTVVSEEQTVPPGRQTTIRDNWKNQGHAHRALEAPWVGKTRFEANGWDKGAKSCMTNRDER